MVESDPMESVVLPHIGAEEQAEIVAATGYGESLRTGHARGAA
jgi:hypothetical protein